MATHSGSCHCGAVRFAVESELDGVIECNCTHCYRKGLQLVFVAPDRFTLQQGEDAVREYLFNRHNIRHQVCTTCGVEPFARGKAPDGSDMVAINVRTLETVEPWTVATMHFDGRKL